MVSGDFVVFFGGLEAGGRPVSVDEVAEAGVAVAGFLVEGVLADHVRDREQEQLALGVTRLAGRALVGAAGRLRLGADQAGGGRADAAAVELRPEQGLLP